ncbi:hypothetical protein D3C84_828140 [compost metagenome]
MGDELRDVLGLPVDVFAAHGLGIVEAFQRAGFAPDHTRQVRPHHSRHALGHRVADRAFIGEDLGAMPLVGRAVSGQRGVREGE